MTALQKKSENPIAHLTAEDVEAIGRELDAIRQGVMDSRGEADAAYIRRMIRIQRLLEIGGRVSLLAASRWKPASPSCACRTACASLAGSAAIRCARRCSRRARWSCRASPRACRSW